MLPTTKAQAIEFHNSLYERHTRRKGCNYFFAIFWANGAVEYRSSRTAGASERIASIDSGYGGECVVIYSHNGEVYDIEHRHPMGA